MAQTVEHVLDTLERSTEQRETVTVDTLLGAVGRRAYGPLVFAIGLVMLSPINWIPGAGIVLATVLTLLLAQTLFRSGPPWIPARLSRLSVDAERARRAVHRVRPWAQRLAVVARPRLRAVTGPPWRALAILAIIATALTMVPLAVIPGGAGPPSLAITVFGLSLTVEDGLLMLMALVLAVAAFVFAGWVFL
ncbi:exopolysaccharide biosynthesis protein [Roseospira marina]|uniref:Exopolysaccharide biosynthesis protein n=1 Tax=Roseospira marina TaxID=140057 RepID=A0A5M6ICK4_9PROT|nr:exopolysaccharide biosynthesis protein [Roseospira marina]KAA5605981.1 exopolysaccharide biosynthesis protein [Roseospira marina]MBB4313170.1 hypothetical protein [Roseospira marina]MBB5086089.1 hypothetical protein [Roseospira marina]